MKLALTLVLFASTAFADDVTGVVFVPQPVRAPVALDQVSPVAPFVTGGSERTGAVDVGPDRAAALWLDALDVVRVRGNGLHFARVVGGAHGKARLEEPGVPAEAGAHYLAEPLGDGDVWMIWADRATTIHVDRPVAREGRAIWDTVQRDLLAWVDRGGARPAVPISDGAYAAALAFDVEAKIGGLIEASDPSLRNAVHAWRKASIIAELTTIRPLIAPQMKIERLSLDGMRYGVSVPDPGVPDPRPYYKLDHARTYELDLEGPGTLRLDARAVLPEPRGGVSNAPELPDVSIGVVADGRTLAKRTGAAVYATAPSELAAFPTKQPLTSLEHDALGERVAVAIALFPGRHHYSIAIDGGAIAVRAAIGRRRPRIAEAIGKDDVDEWLSDARGGVKSNSAVAQLLRALIDQRAGGKSAPEQRTGAPVPHDLPPALVGAWLACVGATPNDIKNAKLDDWTLALAIARRLGDGDAVRALYAAMPGSPPASLIPDLVALLPASSPLERVRNWPLAATALAARARPIDPSVLAATRARWRTGEWVQLRPVLEGRETDEIPPPYRWLVEAEPQPLAAPRAWRTGDLARLMPKQPRKVTATASVLDPARAALLDVFVASIDTSRIDIVVDGKKFSTLPIAPVERVQLAVAPGAHEVSIAGPPSLHGWVSLTPASAVDVNDRARVQSAWPVAVDGTRLRYALPTGDLPIEVSMRALGVGEPIRVTLRADVGAPTELMIARGGNDAHAHALDRSPTDVGDEMRFIYWPAQGAKTVWLETKDPDHVVASISSRRERTLIVTKPSTPKGPAPTLLERVRGASRILAADPDDAATRASRANDLLDLGEPSLAKEDLVRLLRVPAARRDKAAAIEEELFARLDEASEPTHVAIMHEDAVELPTEPILVGPALAAVSPKSYDKAIAALHAGKPDDALKALGDDAAANVIAARAHAMRGDLAAAARMLVSAYRTTDSWPVALEAVDLLARVVVKPNAPAGSIALTYGLAAKLRDIIDHARVRRALVVAAAQSGWDTLGAMSTSAGHEMVLATRPILPPAPSVLVREALLAPAWPVQSAHTLTAGNAAVLDLSLPSGVTVRGQVYCVRVRDAASKDPCELTVKLDNGATTSFTIPPGAATEAPLPALPAGRHVVEVGLAGSSEGDVASVRFSADRALGELTDPAGPDGAFPIRIEHRTKLFVASAQTPVSTTVQGPTTVWVQARALGGGGAHTADVTATSSAGTVHTQLALLANRDDDARGDGRDVVLSTPSDAFLVLPDAVAYQIAVKPDRGELVARMALRDERRGKVPRVPGAWFAAAPPAQPAFAIAMPPAVAAIDAPDDSDPKPGAFTLAFDALGSQDARGDEDLDATKPGPYFESGVTFRRALVPRYVWFGARVAGRGREDTAAIALAQTDLYIDNLPLGASFELRGDAYTQDFEQGRAWHLRGRTRLGIKYPATDTLTIRPSIGFGASYLNTTPAIVSVAMDRIDPDVYNFYRDTHDRDGNVGIALQWQPFQDVVGHVGASATTNRDIASFDHAGANIGVRMLAPLPLVGDTMLAASYNPNYRFDDADRPSAYWRHDIAAQLELTLWTGTSGRFVLMAWDDYVPGKRNAFGGGLRYDLTRHRGLLDFDPNDTPFANLVEHRPYAPLEEP